MYAAADHPTRALAPVGDEGARSAGRAGWVVRPEAPEGGARLRLCDHGIYFAISRAVITPSILRNFSTCGSATTPSMSMML